MNYLLKLTATCLFITLSTASYAQTIKTAINSEVTNNVKFLVVSYVEETVEVNLVN